MQKVLLKYFIVSLTLLLCNYSLLSAGSIRQYSGSDDTTTIAIHKNGPTYLVPGSFNINNLYPELNPKLMENDEEEDDDSLSLKKNLQGFFYFTFLFQTDASTNHSASASSTSLLHIHFPTTPFYRCLLFSVFRI